jgi:hypothetical protein
MLAPKPSSLENIKLTGEQNKGGKIRVHITSELSEVFNQNIMTYLPLQGAGTRTLEYTSPPSNASIPRGPKNKDGQENTFLFLAVCCDPAGGVIKNASLVIIHDHDLSPSHSYSWSPIHIRNHSRFTPVAD